MTFDKFLCGVSLAKRVRTLAMSAPPLGTPDSVSTHRLALPSGASVPVTIAIHAAGAHLKLPASVYPPPPPSTPPLSEKKSVPKFLDVPCAEGTREKLVVSCTDDGELEWASLRALLADKEIQDTLGRLFAGRVRQLQLLVVPGQLNLAATGIPAPFLLSAVPPVCVDREDGPYHVMANAKDAGIPAAAGILSKVHNVVRFSWKSRLTMQVRIPAEARGLRFWVGWTTSGELKGRQLPNKETKDVKEGKPAVAFRGTMSDDGQSGDWYANHMLRLSHMQAQAFHLRQRKRKHRGQSARASDA